MSITAAGGFIAPEFRRWAEHFERAAPALSSLLPLFRYRGLPLDFRPPEVKWAEKRERELRLTTKMWDWPVPPS